jgi:hypothetical protein
MRGFVSSGMHRRGGRDESSTELGRFAPGKVLGRCEEVHAIAHLADQNPSPLAIRAGGIMGNHLALP